MPHLDEKFKVLQELPADGYVQLFEVEDPNGVQGLLYWFEVHNPEARSTFHRYKNAIRKLESANLTVEHVLVSANPGRYYVFWPSSTLNSAGPKKIKPITEVLTLFGYGPSDLKTTDLNGKVVVARLIPQVGQSAAPAVVERTFTPAPAVAPREVPLKNFSQKIFRNRKPAEPVENLKFRWNRWLPGLLLGAVGLMLGWTASIRYLNPPQFSLPDLVGMSPTQAEEAVRPYGLKVAYSEGSDVSKPVDQVLEQNPDAGTRVKPGRRLELTLNKPKFGKVPTIVGNSVENARIAIEAAGYKLSTITKIASGDTRDMVLGSIPQEGLPLKPGESIRILISTGTRPLARETVVPDLTGLSKDDAEYILRIADLISVPVVTASSAPDGIVLGQNPGPGVLLAKEARVQIYISGRSSAKVPAASPFAPALLDPPPPPPPVIETPPAETPTETPPEGTIPTDGATPPPVEQTNERRVNVSYTLDAVEYPNGAVVAIVVDDESGSTTIVEGPQVAGWSINQEVVVRGAATWRVVVDGVTKLEGEL